MIHNEIRAYRRKRGYGPDALRPRIRGMLTDHVMDIRIEFVTSVPQALRFGGAKAH
jgi:hypothetical protein